VGGTWVPPAIRADCKPGRAHRHLRRVFPVPPRVPRSLTAADGPCRDLTPSRVRNVSATPGLLSDACARHHSLWRPAGQDGESGYPVA
jgi:hypothetical protein